MSRDDTPEQALRTLAASGLPEPEGWRGAVLYLLDWAAVPLGRFLHRRLDRIRNGRSDIWWWLALVPGTLIPSLLVWLNKPRLAQLESERKARLTRLTGGVGQ